jgi:hypothetical protein
LQTGSASSNKLLSPSNGALEEFIKALSLIRTIANDFMKQLKKVQQYSTLKEQKKVMGPLLKAPLPLEILNPEEFIIDPLLLKHIGDTKAFF